MQKVFCLSIHSTYRCQRSGACCTANWPIPIEADRLLRLRAALATGVLRPVAGSGLELTYVNSRPDPLLPVFEHKCVFFDEADRRICRVQQALGHDALPLACRQFPRVSLRDPRGVSVTLSHYCPTAASMLDSPEPMAIVESPAAFPSSGEYEGLDARSSLPPLLRPDMLMDWEGWWEWERLSVAALSENRRPPLDTLGRLAAAVESVRMWNPTCGQLLDRIRNAFIVDAPPFAMPPERVKARREEIIDAIPEVFRTHAPVPATIGRTEVRPYVLRRFLAAHAFANWTAYLGQGLRTWFRSIEAAYALLASGLDVRQADLLLRHLADPQVLAKRWSRAEITPLP